MQTVATPLTFILRLSDRCQLRCNYCYVQDTVWRPHAKTMSLALTEKLLRDIVQLEPAPSRLAIILHGGEPLLAGRVAVAALLDQIQCLLAGRSVEIMLQTNGVLLDDEWINLLQQQRVSVGVSLDGPMEAHNTYRRTAGNQPTFAPVLQAIEQLQNNYRSPGVLTVISRANQARAAEVLDFFASHEITSFDFLPAIDGHLGYPDEPLTSRPFVTPMEFAAFMLEAFDEWYARDDPAIQINFFTDIVQGLVGGRPSLCSFHQICHRYLTVDTDGNVYGCSRLVHVENFKLGNLGSASLAAILNGPTYQAYREMVCSTPFECGSCKWWFLCAGGCLAYRVSPQQPNMGPNLLCPAYLLIFQHIANRLAETARKLGQAELCQRLTAYLA